MLTKKQKNQTNKAVFLLRADPTWPHSPSLPFLKLKRTLSLSLSPSLPISISMTMAPRNQQEIIINEILKTKVLTEIFLSKWRICFDLQPSWYWSMLIPHRLMRCQRRLSFTSSSSSSSSSSSTPSFRTSSSNSSSHRNNTTMMVPERASLILRRFLLLVAVSLCCLLLFKTFSSDYSLLRFSSASLSSFPFDDSSLVSHFSSSSSLYSFTVPNHFFFFFSFTLLITIYNSNIWRGDC